MTLFSHSVPPPVENQLAYFSKTLVEKNRFPQRKSIVCDTNIQKSHLKFLRPGTYVYIAAKTLFYTFLLCASPNTHLLMVYRCESHSWHPYQKIIFWKSLYRHFFWAFVKSFVAKYVFLCCFFRKFFINRAIENVLNALSFSKKRYSHSLDVAQPKKKIYIIKYVTWWRFKGKCNKTTHFV